MKERNFQKQFNNIRKIENLNEIFPKKTKKRF